jgi:hypothetical protein
MEKKTCMMTGIKQCHSYVFKNRTAISRAVLFGPCERICRSWAPGKCQFFMWLVAHNKCWTADRLEKKGLPHLTRCPLCDQEPETMNYLLVGCVCPRFLVLVAPRGWVAEPFSAAYSPIL